MNTHELFKKLDSTIKLNDSKIIELKQNRKACRNRIKKHFKDNDWSAPKFYSQGSFPLQTNLNPIEGNEYDLDDGVYFICPVSERKQVSTYHDRIKKAVNGYALEVIDKNTCVRVVYTDKHHIDLPLYWLEQDGDIPQLAHASEGFIDSDPVEFKDWVDNKISGSNSNGQLRRVIRYFKAWKDYRESKNNSLKLPSGFILTILACQNFLQNERDDLAFKDVAVAIKTELDSNFTCYRPTVPTDENLLDKYSKETVLKELQNLIANAQEAIDSDCEKEASEYWRKVFGDRFPLGEGNHTNSNSSSPLRTSITRPWLSN